MKRIYRVFSLGIHNCYNLFWYDVRDSMMISHDDVNTDIFGMTYRIDISCSTVDGDNESDSFCLELIEEITLESISIMNSMRQTIGDETADFSEKLHEDRCRAHTIDIIVTEYDDSFFFFSCDQYSLYGLIHIWHQIWIMEIRDLRIKKTIQFSRIEIAIRQ